MNDYPARSCIVWRQNPVQVNVHVCTSMDGTTPGYPRLAEVEICFSVVVACDSRPDRLLSHWPRFVIVSIAWPLVGQV